MRGTLTIINMKEGSRMGKLMEKVFLLGPMERIMMESGGTEQRKDTEFGMEFLEIPILENGKILKLMDMEFILIWMGQSMKENGKWISNMEREKKYGPIMQNMKEIIKMGRKMVRAFLSGQMELLIRDNLVKTIFKVMEPINGQMEENLQESGEIITWKE